MIIIAFLLGIVVGFIVIFILALISAYKQIKFEKTLRIKTINALSELNKDKDE